MKRLNFGCLARGLFLVSLSTSLLPSLYAQPKPGASGYHLIKTISLPPAPGGEEYYDYITVDAEARRVYVSHGAEDVVLNADDYSVVGRIGGLIRFHGISMVTEVGKGFVTDAASKTDSD